MIVKANKPLAYFYDDSLHFLAVRYSLVSGKKLSFNPLNAELNPICHLLPLGAHHILHVGRIRVNVVAVDKG